MATLLPLVVARGGTSFHALPGTPDSPSGVLRAPDFEGPVYVLASCLREGLFSSAKRVRGRSSVRDRTDKRFFGPYTNVKRWVLGQGGSSCAQVAGSHALHGGYYDFSRKSELKVEFDAIEQHSDVVIDMASTEHLDCSCLGVMVRRLREWRVGKPETQLRLINVAPRLERVMQLLKLEQVFV